MNKQPSFVLTVIALMLFVFSGCKNAHSPKVAPPEEKMEDTIVVQGTITTEVDSTRIINTDELSEPSRNYIIVRKSSGYINGHEWVDLGLSVVWATCNVGANSPSEYGNYYAWGETSTKSEYAEDNCVTYGKNMGSITGNSTYDAARANWGGTWRLPTKEEIDELVSKCTREWTTQGGHNGYKITGPNGNSIFLPAVGWRDGTSLNYAEDLGYYWSATPVEDDALYHAFSFWLCSELDLFGWTWTRRYSGQSVRAVSE